MNQEELKRLVVYNPNTGGFIRKKTNTPIINKCGNKSYIKIYLNGKYYISHRLAWLYMTGDWPKNQIDHINHDFHDNRWCNLRDVTISENQRNAKLRVDNSSGIPGVSWNKNHKRWNSSIKIKGERVHLGSFFGLFEACCARKSAEIKYDFHENHGR